MLDRNSFLIKYSSKYKEILHRLILENMKKESLCSILDIGCRWGDDIERVSKINADKKVVGIDLEIAPLRVALDRLRDVPRVYLLNARSEYLPFKQNIFDIVYSSEVIEHIEKPLRFIQEIYRVLKINGVFIITTPSRYNYVSLVGKLIPLKFRKYLRRYVYYINPGKERRVHIREYTWKELKIMFEKMGLIVERVESGVLRVPIWPLFERFPFLVFIWDVLDRFVDKLPGGIYLKSNFIVAGRKT